MIMHLNKNNYSQYLSNRFERQKFACVICNFCFLELFSQLLLAWIYFAPYAFLGVVIDIIVIG